jgi:hypothetical protein
MREPGDVTLRYGFPDDQPALWRLAALDSAEPLAEPVLIAEVDGVPWAALSLSDGSVVADPFHRTLDVVALLRARAQQLTESHPRHRGRRGLRTRLRFRGGTALGAR